WECDQWELSRSEYRTQTKAMADLNMDISKTIAVRHIHLIKDYKNPYDRLVALKKFLCPTNATCRRELADKYNALKVAPRAVKKIEQWLSDWEDFLITCKPLNQEYATSCLRKIFQHEAQGTADETSSLETYSAEMTTYLRCAKPQSTGLAVLAAELGIANSTEHQQQGRGNRDGVRQIPMCICGKKHWYPDCLILNTRHPQRPNDYQPAADEACKVQEAQRDPKVNTRIKNALERWAARQPQSTRKLRIDNGKPPANGNAFAVT
ncbi:hypothetical protein EJ02DRAFT_317189, partial [Clathrospora elynae]